MMMLLNDGMTFEKLNKYLSSQVLGDQSAVSRSVWQSGYQRVNLGQVVALLSSPLLSLISGLSTRIKQILSTHFCVAVIIGISFSEPAGFSCRPPVKTIEIWDIGLELAPVSGPAVKLSNIKRNKQTGQSSDLRLQSLERQSSDFRPQTSDFRAQTSELRASELRAQTSDLRLSRFRPTELAWQALFHVRWLTDWLTTI